MKIVKLEDKNVLDLTLGALKDGEIVIFPTETCYGVGVDATNPEAVSKLLAYKKRPEGKAISIAVSNQEMAQQYVNLNQSAISLYKEFLPGALTIVSKSKGVVDSRLESENGTLGIRVPNYKFLLDLIEAFGKPITATSANSSGKKTPYSVDDILENISEKQKDLIGLIIDGSILPKNPPTTVIDTTTQDLTIHRKGRIDPKNIKTHAEKITSNVDETIVFARDFIIENLHSLKNSPIVILLNGELGVGKTHFTKGIAQGLGISKIIKSPTYNYVNEYKLEGTQQDQSEIHLSSTSKLYHLDAWRIHSNQDLELLEFKSWFIPGNIIVIEWPSVIMNLDEEFFENISYFYIDFGVLKEDKRQIKIYFKD